MTRSVLVIEDNDLNRDLLRQLLEAEYSVIERRDGIEGLQAALSLAPDLIILDLSLPGLDGWEVARQVRAAEDADRVPIVALTAHAMPGDEESAIAAGCDAYLAKPLDEDDLFAQISELLAP